MVTKAGVGQVRGVVLAPVMLSRLASVRPYEVLAAVLGVGMTCLSSTHRVVKTALCFLKQSILSLALCHFDEHLSISTRIN